MSILTESLKHVSEVVYDKMDDLIPEVDKSRVGESRLSRAMRYSALSDGKRIRPFLVMTSASLFGVGESSASQVASAIEFIHAYSLIHDDLPALDNDDVRRGKPSCHIEFDEATAILAGDALLTYAFEVLSHPTTHSDPKVVAELVQCVAKSIGTKGMIGGQMIDIMSEERDLNIEEITRLQRMKTGALFVISCESGAILGKASYPLRNALRGYAHDIGLAFQITDDILDSEIGSSSEDGDRINKSEEKGTYVSILGYEKAKKQAQMLRDQAISHLDVFGRDKKTECLKELAHYIVDRNS